MIRRQFLLACSNAKFICKLLLVWVVIAIQPASAQPWQKTTFITQSFYEIALGSEYGNSPLIVQKWNKPIRIYVEHQVADNKLHDELLNAHIKDLRSITQLDIARVNSASKANIRYYFTSQQKLPALVRSTSGKATLKHLKGSVCLATMRANSSGIIQSAVVYIPVDQARMHAKLVSCIVEELTQVLGLLRDSDAVFPSIFNDRSHNDSLTGLDIILLKILYSSKIKSGMGKVKLKPLLKSILGIMKSTGEIKKSAVQARKLALCDYLDC